MVTHEVLDVLSAACTERHHCGLGRVCWKLQAVRSLSADEDEAGAVVAVVLCGGKKWLKL